MVSVYGYITVAGLEAFAVTDYGTVDASYIDAVIEANITQAERLVNVYCGQSFTGVIPDGVVYVTLNVAFKFMHNRMLFDGCIDRENFPKRFEELLTKELKEILDRYIDKNLDNESDLIDMYPGKQWGGMGGYMGWYGW